MAIYRFTNEIPLYYSDLGIEFAPDDTHEFDEAPDHHWMEMQEDGTPVSNPDPDEPENSSDNE